MTAIHLFAIVTFTMLVQTPAPWIGRWQLNPAKSTSANTPYKRVTMKIEPREDGLRVTYDMVGTRGGVTHVEWDGKFDGKDHPVQGVDYYATNAYSPIDDHTYSIAVKRDGNAASSIKVTVSSDGLTLTAVATGRNAQGQDARSTTVYDKL